MNESGRSVRAAAQSSRSSPTRSSSSTTKSISTRPGRRRVGRRARGAQRPEVGRPAARHVGFPAASGRRGGGGARRRAASPTSSCPTSSRPRRRLMSRAPRKRSRHSIPKASTQPSAASTSANNSCNTNARCFCQRGLPSNAAQTLSGRRTGTAWTVHRWDNVLPRKG